MHTKYIIQNTQAASEQQGVKDQHCSTNKHGRKLMIKTNTNNNNNNNRPLLSVTPQHCLVLNTRETRGFVFIMIIPIASSPAVNFVDHSHVIITITSMNILTAGERAAGIKVFGISPKLLNPTIRPPPFLILLATIAQHKVELLKGPKYEPPLPVPTAHPSINPSTSPIPVQFSKLWKTS